MSASPISGIIGRERLVGARTIGRGVANARPRLGLTRRPEAIRAARRRAVGDTLEDVDATLREPADSAARRVDDAPGHGVFLREQRCDPRERGGGQCAAAEQQRSSIHQASAPHGGAGQPAPVPFGMPRTTARISRSFPPVTLNASASNSVGPFSPAKRNTAMPTAMP